VLIEETRRMGLGLKAPCVHASDWRFDLEGGAIRFGLGAIKNTGEAAIRAIVKARAEGGPFKDLFDFAARVENRALNRRLVESLVQAGAFDALGPDRARLFAAVPLALDWGARRRQEASAGQESLFGGGGHEHHLTTPPLPDVPPWGALERAAREKEVLGFYLSGHPLDAYAEDLKRLTTGPVAGLAQKAPGSPARVAGVLVGLRKTATKKGDPMAFATLEDMSGSIELLVFPEAYARAGKHLADGAIVWVKGQVSTRDEGERKLLAEDVRPFEEARLRSLGFYVALPNAAVPEGVRAELDRLFTARTGPLPVYVEMTEPDGTTVVLRSGRYRVAFDEGLRDACDALLGPGRARFAARL
jgi:DNA polymerase-3 subunit alpha